MWLCQSDGFLSIVEPEKGGANLLVRARREGDIQKYFPEAKVTRTPGRDYLFRALIDREAVALVVADQVRGISYGNFKNSVPDDKLHSAYSQFWHIASRLQEVPPYSNVRRKGALL